MKFNFHVFQVFWVLGLLLYVPVYASEALPESRLKAAFLYNFVAFTEWPHGGGTAINLCEYGESLLGEEIKALNGRDVNGRHIVTRRIRQIENLTACQVIFIASSFINDLPKIFDQIKNQPVLTIADSAGLAQQGVMINMLIEKGKIVFEVNLTAARNAELTISSRLLSLAKEVYR